METPAMQAFTERMKQRTQHMRSAVQENRFNRLGNMDVLPKPDTFDKAYVKRLLHAFRHEIEQRRPEDLGIVLSTAITNLEHCLDSVPEQSALLKRLEELENKLSQAKN